MSAIPRSLNILPLPVSAISLIFVTNFFCSYTLDDFFFTAPSRTVRHPQFSLYKNIDRGDRDIHASVYLLYMYAQFSFLLKVRGWYLHVTDNFQLSKMISLG